MGAEISLFVEQVWGAFTESRASLVGLAFAMLPAGAMALGLALLNTLAVDLGFDDDRVATLNLWTPVVSAIGCVVGGWMSDRIGRRRALGWFIFSMSPITLWLAWALWHAGWIHPVDPAQRAGLVVPPLVVTVFWLSSLLYCFANGHDVRRTRRAVHGCIQSARGCHASSLPTWPYLISASPIPPNGRAGPWTATAIR